MGADLCLEFVVIDKEKLPDWAVVMKGRKNMPNSEPWVKIELDRLIEHARKNAADPELGTILFREWKGEERDSDNMAVFIASFLIKAGMPFRLMAVAQREDRGFHHVFVQVPYCGQWITLDPHQATMKFARELSISVPRPCCAPSNSNEVTDLSKDPKVKLFRELFGRRSFTNVFDPNPISWEKRKSLRRRFVHLTRLSDQIETLGVAIRDCLSEEERGDLRGLRQMLRDIMADIERDGYCELRLRGNR